MQIIPILAIPNQQLSIVLNQVRYDITLKFIDTIMVADIDRDEVRLISGVRCLAQTTLLPYHYLSANGNFIFLSDEDSTDDIPDWQRFGVTQQLFYLSPSDINDIRNV